MEYLMILSNHNKTLNMNKITRLDNKFVYIDEYQNEISLG